jgi:hypothetical protein
MVVLSSPGLYDLRQRGIEESIMTLNFAIVIFFNGIEPHYNLIFSDEDTRDNAYTLLEEYMYNGRVWANPTCTIRTEQIRLMMKDKIYA